MPDVLKTVGRYEILREVGRGGMAMVYLARQTDLDRFVALKELAAFHASDAAFAQRFLRESRVAGSLSHPNIVTVHDYFEHDGTPYIAMEYVERGSLRPYVGQMSLEQIAGVLEGLLAGLAHAEQHGIVHRDLKPENLMVTVDGRVKIADFGIAKATNQMQTGAFLTATGTTVGTPTYMAPEQAMAQDIGPWTDLYSVGCMAFEMFTGRVPFHDSDAPMAILLRHVNEPIAPVKSIDPAVDQGVSDWVEALLVKDPKQRTQSAAEAWDELRGDRHRPAGPALAPRRAPLGPRRAGRHAQAAHARAVRGDEHRRHPGRGVPELRVGPAGDGHARGRDVAAARRRAARAGDAAAGRRAPGPAHARAGRRPDGAADPAAARARRGRLDRVRDVRRACDAAARRGGAAAGRGAGRARAGRCGAAGRLGPARHAGARRARLRPARRSGPAGDARRRPRRRSGDAHADRGHAPAAARGAAARGAGRAGGAGGEVRHLRRAAAAAAAGRGARGTGRAAAGARAPSPPSRSPSLRL